MSTTPIAIVTGANRGIGRQVTADLAARGFIVIAGARDPAAITPHAQVIPVRLDVNSDDDARAVAELAQSRGGCDLLVNNAGIFPRRHDGGHSESALDVEIAQMRDAFETNTLGPLRLTQALQGALRARRGAVVNVSSGMGQLTEMGGGSLPYRTSKTALHAVTIGCARAFGGNGVVVNAVCPGWVRTDMGGEEAPRALAQGSASVVAAAFLDKAKDDRPTGRLYRDGAQLPW